MPGECPPAFRSATRNRRNWFTERRSVRPPIAIAQSAAMLGVALRRKRDDASVRWTRRIHSGS
jgi:hypothetical protein